MRRVMLAAVPVVAMHGSCALPPDKQLQNRDVPKAVAAQPGIENLVEVSLGVWSGSMPEGDTGFDTLESLGVRTVISVDGARPDVDAARARSMRYVHVPVEYAGLDRDERMNLAKAVRDLPRPIYVHCHHGKHRGPTAVAVALAMTGEITTANAVGILESAGTSPSYPGLWQGAHESATISTVELDAWAAELPEAADVGGFVEGMALLDRVYERLASVRDAGWAVPDDHPDLVPTALAGQLADTFRVLSDQTDEPEFTAAELVRELRASANDAGDLERALDENDTTRAESAWERVTASCIDCHDAWRNR